MIDLIALLFSSMMVLYVAVRAVDLDAKEQSGGRQRSSDSAGAPSRGSLTQTESLASGAFNAEDGAKGDRG